MTPEKHERINSYLAEFGGDLKQAIAAELYGLMVVKDCLGVPAFAESSKMEEMETAFLAFVPPPLIDPNINLDPDNQDSIATLPPGADEKAVIENVEYLDAQNHPEFNAETDEIEPLGEAANDQNAENSEQTEQAAETSTESTENAEESPLQPETVFIDEPEQTAFTDAELFEIVLKANQQNRTIGSVIVSKLYGEKGFNADGSFSAKVNNYKVAYVKGLITQLLKKVEVPATETSQTAETPTEN